MKNKLSFCNRRSRKIFLLLFFIILSGCSVASKLTLFYSGNINGVIEDCRCPKVTDGSILNHITFYKDSIKANSNSLYVSAGNFFGFDHNRKENLVLNQLLEDSGYDLLSPGKNDIYLIDSISNIPIVCYNATGTAAFKRFESGDNNICVTGMIDPAQSNYIKKDVLSDKKISEVKDFIDSLKKSSDIIIFVSNLEQEKEKKIFNEVKNIDIMISNTNSKNESFVFGNRIYISSGSSAEFIGKLEIVKSKDKLSFKNHFIKMDFETFREDPEAKLKADSLKIKYGIMREERSIDSDL